MAVDISGMASGGVVNFVQYGPPQGGYYHHGAAQAAQTELATADTVSLSAGAQAMVDERNAAAQADLQGKIAAGSDPSKKDELSQMLEKSQSLRKEALAQQLQASGQKKEDILRGSLANISS